MNKRINIWTVVVTLLLSFLVSFSTAQDSVVIRVEPSTPDNYVGLGIGLFYFIPVLHTHVGFGNLISEDVDLRVGLELFPSIYGLSADVLYNAPRNPATSFNFYAGGGLRLAVVTDFYGPGIGFVPAIGALGGANFDLGSVDFFTELEADIAISPIIRELPLIFILRSGVNIPF